MVNSHQRINIEWINRDSNKACVTNPVINQQSLNDKRYYEMLYEILSHELPMIKKNSSLKKEYGEDWLNHRDGLPGGSQYVEYVLSYIKEHDCKEVNDVSFKNGEVYIKCSI